MSEKTEQPGHIFQVMGAVVDVKFDSLDDLPNIYTALECDNQGKRLPERTARTASVHPLRR